MKNLMILAVAVAALGACNKNAGGNAAPAASAKSPLEDPTTVVATVGGEKVTLADLDKSVKKQLAQLDEQRHEIRKTGLDALVAEKLVNAAAKKQNMTEEQFLKAEVEDKNPLPGDEEVKAFFDQNQARMPPGATFEQMKDRIANFLGQQKRQQAFAALVERLKAENKVETSLPDPELPTVQVAATGPARGPENAPITIVTFSDFECPFCSKALESVEQVMKEYDGKVRLVFRDYPLPFHAKAQKAAEAAECANEQGKFWQMHDKMFANQKGLEVDQLKGYAKELGLDAGKFDACLDSGKFAQNVKDDMKAGEEAGVNGTPAFFINGKLLSGAQPFANFKSIIDKELAKAGGQKAAAN